MNNSTKQQSSSSFDIKSLILETTSKQPVKKTRSVSETSEPEQLKKKRSGRVSETSDVSFHELNNIEGKFVIVFNFEFKDLFDFPESSMCLS